MGLGIAIKAPSGIVMAAESRVTLSTDAPMVGHPLYVSYDNATKVFGLGEDHKYVGVVTYGNAAIGLRTAHSFLPELQAELPDERLSTREYAERIGQFFLARWQESLGGQSYSGPPMTFMVGGFDAGAAYGEVYELNLPHSPEPIVRYIRQDFGLTWGGQREFVDRLVQGYDNRLADIVRNLNLTEDQLQTLNTRLSELQMQLPIAAMALQDCVDVAIFFLRTTIAAQRLTVGIRGCGGPIDVAAITRSEGLRFVQQKSVHGEQHDGDGIQFPL